MSVETLIAARLVGFAGLYALVADRVFQGHLPQNAVLPAVSFFRVSTPPRTSCMGVDAGVVRGRFQIDCWSELAVDAPAAAYPQVRAIADQVLAAMRRWGTAGPPAVTDTFIVNEHDLADSAEGTYHIAIETEVIYAE